MRKPVLRAIGVALVAACAACDPGPDGPGLIPTPATAVQTKETFTGTVAVGQRDIHNFTVSTSGDIAITLTAAGPPATIVMGLAVGAPSSGSCSLFSNGSVTTAAGTQPQITGTAPTGAYCVAVYDVGNQTAAVTYSVTVAHP